MKRRDAIKRGFGALATLAVGETILLTPDDAQAAWWNRSKTPYGQRKAVRRPSGKGRLHNDYSRATIVKSVCLNCSTVCGIQGYVIDGKLVKVGGNPEDPNNGKSLCAKGQSGPTINNYPERLLYPLKRVGARGSGQWKRITWDEAHDEIATRICKAMAEGKPEEVAIHIGRSRLSEEMGRFMNAIGSPSLFNHRAICSSNKRAANYVSLGETDWESGDFVGKRRSLDALDALDTSVIEEDADLDDDIWWDPARGGTGAGYNINAILPIQPAPLVGMQGWYDTVCTIRKV